MGLALTSVGVDDVHGHVARTEGVGEIELTVLQSTLSLHLCLVFSVRSSRKRLAGHHHAELHGYFFLARKLDSTIFEFGRLHVGELIAFLRNVAVGSACRKISFVTADAD